MLITGTITPFGDSVRLAVKVLDVETANVMSARSANIGKTKVIEHLLAREVEGVEEIKKVPNTIIPVSAKAAEVEGPQSTQKSQPIQPGQRTFTNSIGMKFAYIPSGTFLMGSPTNEYERDDTEVQHEVALSRGYYMGVTEVTQGQWKAVMGNNPSSFKDCGHDCPVEYVSWDDVQAFIRRLNQKEGTNRYRLPTEAEWEYACRAGTDTFFYTGGCLTTSEANYDGKYPLFGCEKGDSRRSTVKVGSFSPNAWGLHDMHGNVWEWCEDWYGDYPSGAVTDPKGPSSGSIRVSRGGSCYSNAEYCRSAYRIRDVRGHRVSYLGFRLAGTFD